MAWIKVETTLPDKPEIDALATLLGIDHDAVVGKLIRVWSWADHNTVSGNAVSVTSPFIDRIVFHPGFAAAMRKVGWLSGREGLLDFPHFDRHNGQTAKGRATTSQRVAEHRKRKCNDPVTDDPLQKPLPDKIREELQTDSAGATEIESFKPDDQWLALLQHNFPDRDVLGELSTFKAFCKKRGTAANRRGFEGWIKKASPSIKHNGTPPEPDPDHSRVIPKKPPRIIIPTEEDYAVARGH